MRIKDKVITMLVRLKTRTEGKDAPTIPEIITVVRAIESVTIARQHNSVKRATGGFEYVDLEIKFLQTSSMTDSIIKIGDEVAKIEGVTMAKVIAVGGVPIMKKGQKAIVFPRGNHGND